MNWYTIVTEEEATPVVGDMIRVATHTALRHTELMPNLIIVGDAKATLRELTPKGLDNNPDINIIEYNYGELIPMIRKLKHLTHAQKVIALKGAAKTELIDIWQSQRQYDELILYTDTNIMFNYTFKFEAVLARESFVYAAPPKYVIGDYRCFDGGFMLFNTAKMLAVQESFVKHTAKYLSPKWILGEDNYASFATGSLFGKLYELNPLYSWKPFWGLNPDAKAIKFDLVKPYENYQSATRETYMYAKKNHLFPRNGFATYSKQWYKELIEIK